MVTPWLACSSPELSSRRQFSIAIRKDHVKTAHTARTGPDTACLPEPAWDGRMESGAQGASGDRGMRSSG